MMDVHRQRGRDKQYELAQLCVAPTDTLRHAMEAIERNGIELAFVCESSGKVVGTLSDGDIRRALLSGAALDEPAVARAMCKTFRRVTSDVGRAEVLDLMLAVGISQVPILNADGVLVGVHLLHDLVGAHSRANRAVIMAGGRGVRLWPLTQTVPKPMLTVAGRPILERLVLHLVGHGIRELYLSINYLGHVIESHFGDGSAFGCKIHYLREEKPLGTGGALSMLPDDARAPGTSSWLVLNGDLVTQLDVGTILDAHDARASIATMCLQPYQVQVPYGVAELDGQRIVALREKPSQQYLINAGVYVLSPEALAMIPNGVEYPITNLFEECISQGKPVGAYVLEGEWIDVGQHDTLRRARGEQ
jgi:dTDP-glucose pyrophosphorylase/predicted transcriptional regulator